MTSKHRIAVLIAWALAMPAGIAALDESAPGDSAEATPSPVTETQAETAARPIEPVAASGAEAVTTAADGTPVERLVRATPSDTFPEGSLSPDYVVLLPAQVAYFEKIERERGSLVARGDAFPEGSQPESEWRMLPAQVAYFDRIERAQVASADSETRPDAMPDASDTAGESHNPLRSAWDYLSGLFKRMGAAISSWFSSAESA